jgi:hypothetical protein
MQKLKLYYNSEYVVEQGNSDYTDQPNIKEQIVTIATILNRLVGTGVIADISHYLADKSGADYEKIRCAFGDYLDNKSK